MGIVASSIALFIFDFLQPGWRNTLCTVVALNAPEECACNVGPGTALLSVGASVTSTCPLDLSQFPGGQGSACGYFSNFIYCFNECENQLQGTVSVTNLESIDFSTSFSCAIQKVDFNFDEIESEADSVIASFGGTAEVSGGVQLTQCASIELLLFGEVVGTCTCTPGACEGGFGDVMVDCDPIKEWNGFSGCISLAGILTK